MPVVVVIFVVEGCVSAGGGIVFVVQSAAFFSSHLSPAAWLVRRPISGTCDYPRGCGSCCVHAPLLEPFVFFVPAMLRVWEITLLLGSGWLRLMGA